MDLFILVTFTIIGIATFIMDIVYIVTVIKFSKNPFYKIDKVLLLILIGYNILVAHLLYVVIQQINGML